MVGGWSKFEEVDRKSLIALKIMNVNGSVCKVSKGNEKGLNKHGPFANAYNIEAGR